MAGINPISGFTPPIQPASTAPSQAPAAGGSADFARAVQEAVANVNQGQAAAQLAMQDLLTGASQDVLPVVSAMAKSDLSFKLLLGVRNKVIEAYKQTMNMQV